MERINLWPRRFENTQSKQRVSARFLTIAGRRAGSIDWGIVGLTRVEIRGADREDRTADSDVFPYFVTIAHGVEDWGVVVKVEDVDEDTDGRRELRTTAIGRLNNEDVVLDLQHQHHSKYQRMHCKF